jgi:hypothetical protein
MAADYKLAKRWSETSTNAGGSVFNNLSDSPDLLSSYDELSSDTSSNQPGASNFPETSLEENVRKSKLKAGRPKWLSEVSTEIVAVDTASGCTTSDTEANAADSDSSSDNISELFNCKDGGNETTSPRRGQDEPSPSGSELWSGSDSVATAALPKKKGSQRKLRFSFARLEEESETRNVLVPEIVSSAVQMWCKKRVKTDLNMLISDLCRRKADSCKQALHRIRNQLDGGSYDETFTTDSSEESNHYFKAFDVYRDVDQCFEMYVRMVSLAEDDAVTEFLTSQRERLSVMEELFTEELEELSERLKRNEGSISDLTSVSLEYFTSARRAFVTAVGAWLGF